MWKQGLIVFVITVAAYLSGLSGSFVFDDEHMIVENPLVNGGVPAALALDSAYWAFTRQSRGDRHEGVEYRPLTILAHRAIFAAGGGSPFLFRLVSIALHALTVLVLFLLLNRLGPGKTTALVATLLFALNPTFNEVVLIASNRSDIVVASSVLLVILLLLSGAGIVQKALAVFGLSCLALFSKESFAFAIPAVLLVSWASRVKRRTLLWGLLFPASLALTLYMLARRWALGTFFVSGPISYLDNPLALADLPTRFATGLGLIARHLLHLLSGYGLCADYSFPQVMPTSSLFEPLSFAGLILVGLFLSLLFVTKSPLAKAGITGFLINILLVSNLLFPIGTVMADRLSYVPALFLVMGGAAIADELKFDRKVKAAAALLWVSGFLLVTVTRIQDFSDTCTLFQQSLRCAPKSAKIWFGCGVCWARGEDRSRAIFAYHRALELYPAYEEAAIQLAQELEMTGHAEEGLNLFATFLAQNPSALRARFFYASMLAREGQYEKAIDEAERLFGTPWEERAKGLIERAREAMRR